MNWISQVLDEAKEAETPTSYLYWSMVAALAATAANYVYINRKGVYQLRPNVYIMLMGRSALGKGFPVNTAKKLVTLARCTRVISGRNSIQSVVKDLATQESSEDGPVFKDSRGFFVSSEFATSLIKDEAALTILTDLYDCHWNEEWNNKIISRGTDKVIKPNLTILSGSSPSHFFDTIPQTNISGGFVGRMLIIYEEKRSKINDLMSDVEGEVIEDFKFPYDKLAAHLKNINETLKEGPERKFMWTPTAAKVWRAWYTPQRNREETEGEDKTGFKGRLPDHVLKVAMCLSLSEGTTLKINETNIEEAIEQTSGLLYTSKRVTAGIGKDPLAPQAKIILEHLLSAPNHELTRKRLLQKGHGDFDSAVLDRIIDTVFVETGWVEKVRVVANVKGELQHDWSYKLTPEGLADYEKFIEIVKEK